MNRAERAAVAALAAAGSVVACHRPVALVQAPMAAAVGSSAIASPLAPVRPTLERPATGTWTGVGTQSDGRKWPVRVELTAASGSCGTIVYPTVPCRGTWTCAEGVQPDGWREAVESIQSGSCIDGGTFRYRLRGESLEWSWSKDDGQNLTARGVLTRNDDARDRDPAAKNPDWDSDEE